MSINADDVLDDWEEIDEVSLNTKLDQLKKESAKMNGPSPPQSSQPPLSSTSTASVAVAQQNGKAPSMKMLLMHNNDDDYRTQYGPIEPTVKILKRPTLNNGNKTNSDAKPKAPVKSLQQREHEYAQARLRIMGSAQSPEDNAEQNGVINTIRNTALCGQTQSPSHYHLTNGTSSEYLSTKLLPQHNQTHNNQSQTPPQLHQPQQQNQQQLQQRPQDGIIRLPRGPNGTTGFMIRR